VLGLVFLGVASVLDIGYALSNGLVGGLVRTGDVRSRGCGGPSPPSISAMPVRRLLVKHMDYCRPENQDAGVVAIPKAGS
jgi:hypothetical protein